MAAQLPIAPLLNPVITKNTVKFVHSLSLKKYRDAEQCFVGEGPKVVADLLPLIKCRTLFATAGFLRQHSDAIRCCREVLEVTQAELERLSLLKSPREALGIFDLPRHSESAEELSNISAKQLCLALDGVQDPGNLGTILRIADWFGIEHLFASPDTADAFAPKVVQATMGAIGRVKLHYMPISELLSSMPAHTPVYGTFLDGDNMNGMKLENRGLIVMGNEGKGISDEVGERVTHRLFIPNYPKGRPTSESLNVAVATAIVCAAFRSQS